MAISTHSRPINMLFADKPRLLTAKKKKRQNKLDLCKYCGQPSYIAKSHNNTKTLQAKRRAADLMAANLTVSSSKLDTSGKMLSLSIVSLEDQ